MSGKLPLIVALICAGSLAGYFVFMFYKRKKEYFYELNRFVASFLTSVSYTKDTVLKIVGDFDTSSKLLKKHLDEYINCKKEKSPLILSSGILSKGEIAFIKSLFEIFGTSDSGTQNSSIRGKKEELERFMKSSEEKFKLNGSSSVKLGFLGGLLIAVLCV